MSDLRREELSAGGWILSVLLLLVMIAGGAIILAGAACTLNALTGNHAWKNFP